MPEKEIEKPSLTQRRKITGVKSTSVYKPTEKVIQPSLGDESDDISVGKVVLVILGVVIIAVIAAVLIIKLQGDKKEDNNEVKPTPTISSVTPSPTITTTTSVTPTVTPTIAPTTTPGVTPTVTTTPPTGTNLENDWGKTTQYITSGASGSSIKIRTFMWSHEDPSYYEFALPTVALSGSVTLPNAKAYYSSDTVVKLEVQNIGQFASCNYINEQSTAIAYGNVNSVNCEKSSDTYTFTFTVGKKTDIRLTTGDKKINEEEVNSILIQIKKN